jgi:prepilin-type N-terminal cleavage/methylation domain-containing protein
MRRRAFTLVELMTVLAIMAILYAIAVPAFIATKAAVKSAVSMNGLKDLSQSLLMYVADSDDNAPLAMYNGPNGLVAWFGSQTGPGVFDPTQGILSAYEAGKNPHDPTYQGEPWLGDGSGYGYNWGYIGSDFNMQPFYQNFPNCRNAASMTSLSSPSTTILFATSAYYSAPWTPGGNGKTYDFGFIDPPRLWKGNPNVDFREEGTKSVNMITKQVTSTGHANVVRADGSARPKNQGALDDAQFER